jgi:ComF family protein
MRESMARPMWRWFQRWLEAGLTLLYPSRCAGCGEAGSFWCAKCDLAKSKILQPFCPRCGFPIHARVVCDSCHAHPLPLTVRSYAFYEGSVASALLYIKYRPNQHVASMMSEWLVEIFNRENWKVDLVTPVPLGKQRLRQRGFNQADLVARHFIKRLDLPYIPDALIRTRDTRSQVGLDSAARHTNVQGAFRSFPERVQDRSVLVIDDLYTTGATLCSCAFGLMDSGATRVYGLTVGRARGKIPTRLF